MIYILEIVLSGLLGILIGCLVSILFTKDYSLKGVMKSIDRFFNPIYHKDNKKECVWFVADDGNICRYSCKASSSQEMIHIMKCCMKDEDFSSISFIPAAAFVLYADELSYEDRCKAYRDVRDAIREYKKKTK